MASSRKKPPRSKKIGRRAASAHAASGDGALRIGVGNDIHQLAAGKKLILGGVEIRSEKGTVAHSDGDALIHAVCDALLGAARLGDIGRLFPDSAPRWRNAPSLLFLRHVAKLLAAAGFEVVNLDAIVGLERPRLRPHIGKMERNMAQALGIGAERVSVKAKTGEGLDAVGRGEAVRSDAVALLRMR